MLGSHLSQNGMLGRDGALASGPYTWSVGCHSLWVLSYLPALSSSKVMLKEIWPFQIDMVFLLFSHPQEEAGLDCRFLEVVLRVPSMSTETGQAGHTSHLSFQ